MAAAVVYTTICFVRHRRHWNKEGIPRHLLVYAHVHELLHAMQKNLHRAIQQNAELSLIIRLKSAKINYKPTFILRTYL